MKLNLNANWTIQKSAGAEVFFADVPCSVFSVLLDNKIIDDPYYGENEYKCCHISDDDYIFTKEFSVTAEMLAYDSLLLHFDGIDTIASIRLNGKIIGTAGNMHRTYEFDAKSELITGVNKLEVLFSSPTKYIKKKQEERPLWGVGTTIDGYAYIRKAHYMLGWDWGPQLPDMGLWRGVSLLYFNATRIDSALFSQQHSSEAVELAAKLSVNNIKKGTGTLKAKMTVSHDGDVYKAEAAVLSDEETLSVKIDSPCLWWPNGYGKQPLYDVLFELFCDDVLLDTKSYRIGLRELTVSNEKDEYGREFCFKVNGKKIFAMGANYIPEDQIIPRCNEELTRDLLEQCAWANYNCIRVWGGGYYPDDYFYNICDELGLIVWQDFMFACAVYVYDDEFKNNVTKELTDNIKRLRHHASLGLFCGNNENEAAWCNWGIPQEEDLKKYYTEQFEKDFPAICKKLCPDVFYWSSSPSSYGEFNDPNNFLVGDTHNWEIWHGFKPLTEFRNYKFRFCSEYGFEAIPSLKTIRTFAQEKDLNLSSPVMEAHQKCVNGNEKLMYYMASIMPYPNSFPMLIYATQLMQADAIRYSVEHMRRNRGICMGSTYWQVNDTNPVISWASFDYCHRLKAMHYYAKRFYTPVLLSANEDDVSNIVLNMSNETLSDFKGKVKYALRKCNGDIINSGSCDVAVPALSASDILSLDYSDILCDAAAKRSSYLEYSLIKNDTVVSYGTSLFVLPKHFDFVNPQLSLDVKDEGNRFAISVSSVAYAKSVCLDLKNSDCRFSDNWFDVHGDKAVTVYAYKETLSAPLTLNEFKNELLLMSCYDIKNS